jgi:purine nucleosidase/pyrimidine-specific ribonucleoside hydrolase
MAADPEAARIVLRAGLPLTLIPLDVTRKVRATRAWCAGLADTGLPGAVASARLIEAYFHTTTVTGPGAASRPLHDPCVMLLAEAPALFGTHPLALEVDVGTTRDAGALSRAPTGPTVAVALRVDSAGALALLAGRLTGEPAA